MKYNRTKVFIHKNLFFGRHTLHYILGDDVIKIKELHLEDGYILRYP